MPAFVADLFNGVVDVIVRDGSELLLVAAAIVTGFVLFWLLPPEKKVHEAKRKVRLQAQAKSMKVLEDYYQESGDEEDDQGEHDLCEPNFAPPLDGPTSEGGASDVNDVSKCLASAFSPADEDDGEDASGVAAIDVNDVADVFMRLSRAFFSADESEDEDDHVLPKPTDSTFGEAASEVDQVADVFVRLSRAFSSVDEDEDEDEDDEDHDSLSRWKPTGSTSREVASEVDSVTDVFMRLSKVFSSACEDDDDDDHGSSNLSKPKLTPSNGPTFGGGDVNVVHVADVFLTVFKVISSVDADQDEDDYDVFSLSKPELTPSHGPTSGGAAVDIHHVADVFKKLSKAFSSVDEDDVDDEYGVCIPLEVEVTPTLHALTSGTAQSDVNEVAGVFLGLSKAFSSYEDEPEYNLIIAQKATCTASSDGSTYGGATSDSEDETLSWEASDSEGETHADTTD